MNNLMLSENTTHFIPDQGNTRLLRDALGQFATGVCIVTCRQNSEPMGMTVNSFTSVSLDPALILWCVAKTSRRHASFVAAQHFAVHILPSSARAMGEDFARLQQPFDAYSYTTSDQGVPLLDAYVCRLECEQDQRHEAGDHDIIIGKVTAATTRTGEPLIFARGQFSSLNQNLDNLVLRDHKNTP